MNNTEKKIFEAMTSHDEKIIGAIFTTYNFDPKYFETHFLPALLCVDNNEEAEENLQALDLLQNLEERPIAVLMDARANLKCERKFPNYDLFPIADTTQHSKISILIFPSSIKLFISSANLTKTGLHTNKEAYVELAFENDEDEWSLLDDVIYFLKLMTKSNKIENCKAIKLLVQKYNELKPEFPTSHNLKFQPVGPLEYSPVNFAEEVKNFWAKNTMDGRKKPKIACICVQTPFFENTTDNDNNLITYFEKQALKALEQKDEPHFDLMIPTCQGKRMTKFPILAYKDYENVTLWENPNQRGDKEIRFPHLKTYLVSDQENYSMFMIGSSNFSPSALGIAKTPNWEANILFFKPEYSNKDMFLLSPKTNEIEDIEKNDEDNDSEFLKDEEYPDPVISLAIYEKRILRVQLFKPLIDNQILRIGTKALNENFKDCILEIGIDELNDSNLVVEEPGTDNQIFPITIVDGTINDCLKLIPPEIIAKFIEARYRYGDHLKISDFIMEQRRIHTPSETESSTFDTTNLLLYEIREFNHVTTNIFHKLKADANYSTKVYYHLNSRFGLLECIKNYCEWATKPEYFVTSNFKCMETITQVLLAFEGCVNQDSLKELDTFYQSAMRLIDDIQGPQKIAAQISIYKSYVQKLMTSLNQKVAV